MEEINNKAMAERIALEQEYRYGVSSPVLVELQMMKNALGDVHILDENQQSINAAFGVELAKLQQTLPKDFVPPLTQYVNDTLNQEIATTATQSRNDGLNSGSLNAPQTIEEMQKTLRIAKCLQGEPVCVLNERQAPQPQPRYYAEVEKWAGEIFESWGFKAISPELGRIELTHRSIKDSNAHKLNPFKAEAYRSIKDVIEQGVVFAETKVGKEEHYFIAAPVTIDNEIDLVTVLVQKNLETQTMYLHSVMIREKILTKNFEQNKTLGYSSSVAETLKNEPEPQGKLYPRDTGRILQNFLKVNISQLEIDLNQQIEQMKGNKMDEQQQQAIETALFSVPKSLTNKALGDVLCLFCAKVSIHKAFGIILG